MNNLKNKIILKSGKYKLNISLENKYTTLKEFPISIEEISDTHKKYFFDDWYSDWYSDYGDIDFKKEVLRKKITSLKIKKENYKKKVKDLSKIIEESANETEGELTNILYEYEEKLSNIRSLLDEEEYNLSEINTEINDDFKSVFESSIRRLSKLKEDPIRIYRGITVDKNQIEDYYNKIQLKLKKEKMGDFWSYEHFSATEFSGDVSGIVFWGWINLSDVNIIETIRSNITKPFEYEIWVRDKAKIRVDKLEFRTLEILKDKEIGDLIDVDWNFIILLN